MSNSCATNFIWPLSRSATPDEMNTSFGPRVDSDLWDFHDGIDLPAAIGTPVYAMANGVVHRAGPADKTEPGKGFGSTHVLLKVVDPTDGKNDLFLVYLHLDSIAEGVIPGAQVYQGDVIGAMGQEDATYPHLHFEFRKGGPEQMRSVHPLHYLPYLDTANFTQLHLDRSNFYGDNGDKRAVRLCFAALDRRESDLQAVDVELQGDGVAPRKLHVDFDNRETIVSDKGDEHARIGKSNALLPQHRREGLLLGCVCYREPPSLAGMPAVGQPCRSPPGRQTADVVDGQQKASQPCDVEEYWGWSACSAATQSAS